MDYSKVISVVYEASKFVFSKEIKAVNKDGNPNDFVTAVDIAISDFVKAELKKDFPDVGFVTEEEREHAYAKKSFILDPIDGTTNLVFDYKLSSVSLAYQEDGQVKFGVVYNPFSKELFFAIKGKGSYLYVVENGLSDLFNVGVENYTDNCLKVSDRALANSIIEFGANVSDKSLADLSFERGKRVYKNCLDLRRTCSSAIAICYIACGRLDGYFEQKLKPWDYAAATLILEEAGGKSCDFDGDKLPLDRNSSIICANAVILEELKKLVVG